MKFDKKVFARAITAAGLVGTAVYCHGVGIIKVPEEIISEGKELGVKAAKAIGTDIINKNNVIDTKAEV